ncbi:unnamed protein product [Vitrella brassicaformis CCMP3155]|uniref:Uncharacterized protein n=1 Tax=Vitrella brassicaformis (strain CCMP3155) TaxID=1169540 RepID=A0A0G4G0J8_VITBC|nr:unnamed protein product [Vitrella brassicaformis CCMP3155]|eukprot:CEM21290.1 unnamed protein product [Vitrella brassicaformis CCMP3155]
MNGSFRPAACMRIDAHGCVDRLTRGVSCYWLRVGDRPVKTVQDGRKAAHLAKIVTQTHGIHRVRLESAPSALDVGVRVFDFGHDGEATR